MQATVLSPWITRLVLLALPWLLSACGLVEKQKSAARLERAQALYQQHCRDAGEKIYKTVDNVEGIFLSKVRPDGRNCCDQFALDDPYGHDSGGNQYITNFLQGSYAQKARAKVIGAPSPVGYKYVEAFDPADGQRYRYTSGVKAVRLKDVNAAAVQLEMQRNPAYDLNVYETILIKELASGDLPRYGVTYDDISTREDREYWIAGSSLKVIDTRTNEVLAERVGYMLDRTQGKDGSGVLPWLSAADNACPGFQRNPFVPVSSSFGGGSSAQPGQTLFFVEKVLIPKK